MSCEYRNLCSPNPCKSRGKCAQVNDTFTCTCLKGYEGSTCDIKNPCLKYTCKNGGTCFQVGGEPICKCTEGYIGDLCELENPCFPNPCENLGTCTPLLNGYSCTCLDGYSGSTCKIKDVCYEVKCANGGVCQEVSGIATCQCPQGYTGQSCEKRDMCFPNPCENGGICSALLNNYTCVCPAGFRGENCELKDLCWNITCYNGGTCLQSRDEYNCMCHDGYSGDFCQIVDLCHNVTCLNGGTCVEASGTTTCHCSENYLGPRCEFANACLNDPCGDRGICAALNDTYVCTCFSGFYGKECERRDLCHNVTCENGGTCYTSAESAKCLCSEGYLGDNCQEKDVCETEPCANGGVCTQVSSTYTCSCAKGYKGTTCEDRDFCADEPCGIHGRCEQSGEQFFCKCDMGWRGRLCDSVDYCHTNPCQNGGTCELNSDTFICVCVDGFQGDVCQFLAPCSSTPCLNNGNCTESEDTYICTCSERYLGPTCDQLNLCFENPCLNGGVCEQGGAGGVSCSCTAEYFGDRCQHYNFCSQPCKNGGTCRDYFNICECKEGYSGERCEVKDFCYDQPCKNGGTCVSLQDEAQCFCTDTFTGRFCDVDICNNQCKNGAGCVSINGEPSCSCKEGYIGQHCEFVNYCLNTSCENGGFCQSLNDSFSCSCREGYLGKHCELKDHCLNISCENGGSCTTTDDTFHCSCTEGFLGERCELKDYCFDINCKNDGLCLVLNSTFRCSCKEGFRGEHCELIDHCANINCENSGVCGSLEDTFQCECKDGYEGRFCELLNPCTPKPCRNDGECLPTPTGYLCVCKANFTGQLCEYLNPCLHSSCQNGAECIPDGKSYHCSCPEGFSGDHCELSLDPCSSSPCNNGSCTPDVVAGFKCSCSPGYTGNNCETSFSFCTNSPCRNNGSCRSADNFEGYICSCSKGYTGRHCETVLDPCSHNPCRNDARCLVEDDGSFRCLCNIGFKGIHCEFAVNPCQEISPSPCLNGGSCVANGSSHHCMCPVGYHGRSCEDLAKCLEETTDSNKGSFAWVSVEFGETLSLPCPYGPYDTDEVESASADASNPWSQFESLRPTRMAYPVPVSPSTKIERKSLIARKSNDVVNDRLDFSWKDLEKSSGQTSENKIPRDKRSPKDVVESVQQHAIFKDLEYRSELSTSGSWKDLNRFSKEAMMKLDENGRAQAVRSCVLHDKTGQAIWLPVDDSSCNESPREGKRLPIPLETNLSALLSNPGKINADQFKGVAKEISAMVEHAARSPEVAQKLLNHVSNLLEVDDAVLQEAAASADLVLQSLNTLSKTAIVKPGSTFAVKSKNLVMETKVISTNQTFVPQFRPDFVDTSGNMTRLGNRAESAKLVIPDELVKRFIDKKGSVRLQFMSFKTSKLFRENKTCRASSSYVLSASIENENISDLVNPVRYFVPIEKPENHYCAFWDEEGKYWSTEGLKTKHEAGRVVCESTHLTSFSILFDPYATMRWKLPEEHRIALSIISYLGSALSMFGLTITVFTYGLFRVLRRDRSGKILLNLSISLLLLNLVFLLNAALDIPLNADDESEEVFLFQMRLQSNSADATLCVTLAILMHYLVLTSLTWMLVEAAHMYHLLITVFAGTETYFILKRAILAWGVPALIVTIVASVSLDHYRDPNSESCQLSPSNVGVYYGAYIVPSALIIVTNCVVFLLVVRVILVQGRRQAAATKFGTPEKELSNSGVTVAQIRGGITVMALVGATWVTGPLAVGILRLPMQYLFCLTNSLQGFVIFLVRVVLFPDARNAWITLFRFGHISKTRRDISHGSYSNSHSTVRNTRSTSTNLLHSTSSNASSIVRMRAGRDEFAGLTRDSPKTEKPDRLLSFKLLKNGDIKHEAYCPCINPSMRIYQSKGSSFSEKACICPKKDVEKSGVVPTKLVSYNIPEVSEDFRFEASRTFPRPNSDLLCPEVDLGKTHIRPSLTETSDESAQSSWMYVKPENALPGIEESPHSLEHINDLAEGWSGEKSNPVLRDCSSEVQLPRVVEMEPKVKNPLKSVEILSFKDLSEISRSSPCIQLSGQNVTLKAATPKIPLLTSESYES